MELERKTPHESIAKIYEHIRNGAEVHTMIGSVESDSVYIAVPLHRPSGRFKLALWNTWGLFEIYTPRLLAIFTRLLARTSRKTRFSARAMELTGQRLNGNLAAPEALAKGASVAVVDSRFYRGDRYIYVRSTDNALSDIARHHRNQFDITCIGITGSCGKTTTRELVAAVVSTRRNTIATLANSNTMQGVAHTALRITPQTEAAVIEIASTGSDSVARQSEIIRPNLGIITNIGKAHLLGFGDLDGVEKIKRQLFDFVAENDGLFFANIDDPRIEKIAHGYENVWTFGESSAAKTQGHALDNNLFLSVRISLVDFHSAELGSEYIDINTQLFGRYNLSNILAAFAVGQHLGIDPHTIRGAIEGFSPDNGRSQVIKRNTTTYIMDAYNANPTSMTAALESFSAIGSDRKIAILGDMLELGVSSEREHSTVLKKLETMDLDKIILVGSEFPRLADQQRHRTFPTVEALNAWVTTQDFQNAIVLIKGSQGIGLEAIDI
jgi:UDP-N-acetylmuramoyl-tripeptide--D-alanyl-D-alanine ligase